MLHVVDDMGVKYFTVYAFSTENWNRSKDEVDTLMKILRTYLADCVAKSMKNNVRCRVIGRPDGLSQDILDSIHNLEEKTKNNTGLNFTIAQHLDTWELPDPDLLIRTSGEERLSNFLPWQLAYTEFYFTSVLWPDFNEKEMIKAIEKYNKRERRFGGVKEEQA